MATLGPNTIFAGRYKIRALLGVGGMGAVYRAEHLALRKDVALKVLTAKAPADGETRFEREALAIARLDHPSCIRILDYGRSQQAQFIAMELLAGETLGSQLRAGGAFSTGRAVRIARSVLSALAHAHAHGVLHRDVKPDNVMLVGPRVVLIDFGLASLRDERPLTGNGMCLGSPSYIAPERLLGKPYDARADLYAVGIVLYEMLAGRRPFIGPSPDIIMHEALTKPPRPLRALRKDVSRSLDAVIRRALAKDPDRRYADAEEMLSALDDVPVLEELHERIAAAERDEQATTLRMVQLELARPSWWQRVRTWLRYGRWRWRAS